MLKIYNLKDKQQYIEEIAILTQKEWGDNNINKVEFQQKIKKKIAKIISSFENKYYSKLILLDDDKLVGFISIFEYDCSERLDLYPWYATMYVKKEYRGFGYSKILNDAILREAKAKNIARLYLKTDLKNYYEKFDAKYLCDLSKGEKIFYFDI